MLFDPTPPLFCLNISIMFLQQATEMIIMNRKQMISPLASTRTPPTTSLQPRRTPKAISRIHFAIKGTIDMYSSLYPRFSLSVLLSLQAQVSIFVLVVFSTYSLSLISKFPTFPEISLTLYLSDTAKFFTTPTTSIRPVVILQGNCYYISTSK